MTVVRIEHGVPSFETWKQAFDSDPADRKGAGVLRYQIMRAQDDPNYVMIDLEFENVARAEAFLQTMQRIWSGSGKTVMQNPRARLVDVVEVKDV
jgi:quinol monooxygenase YgiN